MAHRDLPPAKVQLVACVGVAVVVGAAVALLAPSPLAALVGFDAGALLYVGWLWATVWRLDAARTSQLAVREDPSRGAADIVLLGASTVSLVAVALVLTQASSLQHSARVWHAALAVASVVVSWATVHSVFALKYARLYYCGTDGGVNFKSDVAPPYSDFAYLSFTIGMTFQVSDTDLQHPDFRRLVLRHSLLSYLFGTVIVASAINLLAGIASGGG